MIWRVPFRISGYTEIEASDADGAWEEAHKMSVRDLVCEDVTVDFEVPECQD